MNKKHSKDDYVGINKVDLRVKLFYIVVQSLVINIGTCFASSYNVFRADDLSYGNVFRELRSRKTLP